MEITDIKAKLYRSTPYVNSDYNMIRITIETKDGSKFNFEVSRNDWYMYKNKITKAND